MLDRPEIEAKGGKVALSEWNKADFFFWEERGKKGIWKSNGKEEKEWSLTYHESQFDLHFQLELSNYKHIGLFPEQVANWKYIADKISQLDSCKFLNLFAYTSAASLVASKYGAEVVNVEALKQLTQWSKKNAELNQIDNIRWLTEDARVYVERAVRRGEKFNGILLDPPAFGYGSKGKRWMIEKDLAPLLKLIKKLMDPKKSFLIINTYSPKMPLYLLRDILVEEGLVGEGAEYKILGLESRSAKQVRLGNLVRYSNF